MALNRIKSKVIVPHSKSCTSKNSKYVWSGLLDSEQPYYYGNWAANITGGAINHIWYRVLCNCIKCPAIKAVHSSVLIEA